MTDEQFIARFEDCTLPAASFHHREHIKVVWLYLQCYPVLETLTRFAESLQRFAAANRKPDLYHETITWAFVFLIQERIERNGHDGSWAEFMESNADLFDWENNVLKSYYRAETLRSDLARKVFVFPDKLGADGKVYGSSGLSAPGRPAVS